MLEEMSKRPECLIYEANSHRKFKSDYSRNTFDRVIDFDDISPESFLSADKFS